MKCSCGENSKYFHSKCCNSHFEGIILENGEMQVVCEKCGKYVGTLGFMDEKQNIHSM